MKKIKKSALFAAFFIIVGALAGCGGNNTASSNEVYFLNFKPEIGEIYKEIATKYKEETGVTIKVVTAASGTYEQTLKSEIAKSQPPTIFQVNGPVGYGSWKDYCMNLSSSQLYTMLSDKDLAITEGDGVYAIPYAIEGYGIICNGDIMDKYFALEQKTSGINSLEEINSFEALKSVTEDIQKNKDALGIDGAFAATSLATGDQWRWQTHLANAAFYHEFNEKDDAKSTIMTALETGEIDFMHADKYKNLFDLYLDNSTTDKGLLGSKTTADSMAEFALGKCAMVQNGTWSWAQIKDVQGNTVNEDAIEFIPMYMDFDDEENMGICIGTESYFAINEKATDEQKKAAEDFLVWLFSSQTGKDYVINKLGFNAPFTTFGENERPSDPLSRDVQKWVESGKDNIEWTFQGFPNENFKNDFGGALLQYAQGNHPWENVVTTVTDAWKREFGNIAS